MTPPSNHRDELSAHNKQVGDLRDALYEVVSGYNLRIDGFEVSINDDVMKALWATAEYYSKQMSLEWRIEQWRRAKPYMLDKSWQPIFDELTALIDLQPSDPDTNTRSAKAQSGPSEDKL
jgi:hypothetical protein